MKRERSTTGATTRKSNPAATTGLSAGPAGKPTPLSAPSTQSVSPAVYSRYIDSRMKQFGTR